MGEVSRGGFARLFRAEIRKCVVTYLSMPRPGPRFGGFGIAVAAPKSSAIASNIPNNFIGVESEI